VGVEHNAHILMLPDDSPSWFSRIWTWRESPLVEVSGSGILYIEASSDAMKVNSSWTQNERDEMFQTFERIIMM